MMQAHRRIKLDEFNYNFDLRLYKISRNALMEVVLGRYGRSCLELAFGFGVFTDSGTVKKEKRDRVLFFCIISFIIIIVVIFDNLSW